MSHRLVGPCSMCLSRGVPGVGFGMGGRLLVMESGDSNAYAEIGGDATLVTFDSVAPLLKTCHG